MKKLLCLALFAVLLVGTVFAEVPDMESHVFDNDGYELPYRLYVPESGRDKYPVILFLHGAGERGNDNSMQINSAVRNLFYTAPELLNECIFILPQCPEDEQWVGSELPQLFCGNYSTKELPEAPSMTAAIALLQSVLDNYPCDRDRVYIMGLSMGGFGSWDALIRHGDLFAAAVPICGGGDEAYAEELAQYPIWAYHGTADPLVTFEGTERMFDLITAAGGQKMIFTPVEGGMHNVWDEACSNPELINWLFSQSRGEAPEPIPEVTPTSEPIPQKDENGEKPPFPVPVLLGAVLLLSAVIVLMKRRK